MEAEAWRRATRGAHLVPPKRMMRSPTIQQHCRRLGHGPLPFGSTFFQENASEHTNKDTCKHQRISRCLCVCDGSCCDERHQLARAQNVCLIPPSLYMNVALRGRSARAVRVKSTSVRSGTLIRWCTHHKWVAMETAQQAAIGQYD